MNKKKRLSGINNRRVLRLDFTFQNLRGRFPSLEFQVTPARHVLHPATCLSRAVAILIFFCFIGGWHWIPLKAACADVATATPTEQDEILVRLSTINEEQNQMRIMIIPKTQAREIFFRLSPDADFRSTGFLQHFDPISGARLPNGTVLLTKIVPTLVVETKYIGTEGKEYGPFITELDIASEALDNVKHQLLVEHTPWITFRTVEFEGKKLSMFTHIFATQGSSYAVEKIRYGINTKKPNIIREPLDTPDPHNTNSCLGEIDKTKTSFVSMQIFFKDGTQSDIRMYEIDTRSENNNESD